MKRIERWSVLDVEGNETDEEVELVYDSEFSGMSYDEWLQVERDDRLQMGEGDLNELLERTEETCEDCTQCTCGR